MKLLIKRKPSLIKKVKNSSKKIEPELRELVFGRRTIISLLSFGVGTVLIGNFIWKHSSFLVGDWTTLIVGALLFILGGISSKKFNK